ncbi:paired immunoglobulin-like type 2 receptor beta [Mauremys reevesii]|uniref:paired immunoglobulin-like type 2 receptor beta n=1 Tax=Mauremys reevesii TaxID=260615 RepID=UPI00193EEF7D|nr:paired immunoglobulin-like type 2 receptor beta [Mauremys reevesii]
MSGAGVASAGARSRELLRLLRSLVGAVAQDPRYTVTQPMSLSAPAGGSVTLPCAFTYPREIEPLRDLRVYWRRGGYHGPFIYNHTEGFTLPDYGGRITLVGDPQGNRTASICINWLWKSDASEYVCHIRVQKNDGQWFQWRGNPGTRLTVTAPSPTDSMRHPEMVTTGVGRTYHQRIDAVILVLIGLILLLFKAGIFIVVFAMRWRLGWGHGSESVTGRVPRSDAPSASGFELTSLVQSPSPGIPGE